MKPDSAIAIVRTLRERGHEAYLVGGCVRDMVMGIEPSDYDIATSAHPEDVRRIFPRTEAIGAQFGVILVIDRGHPFEVATFRSDDAYIDGRRPSGVTYTDARTDVQRRDFTINGLLFDPLEDRVIDYVDGQQDIRDRIVRAIGDPAKRFEEDKLRMLRAIRFGARLGYTIEPATWTAVRRMASGIVQVSMERVRDELARILTEGQAARGCRMLYESGLLAVLLPEVHWDRHLERSLELLPPAASAELGMAALLHEVAPERAAVLIDRFKLSRAESRHVAALLENRPRFQTVREMPVRTLKRFFRLDRFEDHLELARMCAAAADGSLEDYNFALTKFRAWSYNDITPAPLISGEDLKTLGFAPGPLFKEILTRVEDEQLEGRLGGRQHALDFVTAHYASRRS